MNEAEQRRRRTMAPSQTAETTVAMHQQSSPNRVQVNEFVTTTNKAANRRLHIIRQLIRGMTRLRGN